MAEAETETIGHRLRAAISGRAIVLGLVLIPINALWIEYGLLWRQSRPTTVSLYFNVIFTLLLVVAANALLQRFASKWALRPAELVTVYAMCSLGSSVAGLDQVQVMVPVIAYPHYAATPENKFEDLFLPQVPPWMVVTDLKPLERYFNGGESLYARDNWRAWLKPGGIAVGFHLTMLLVMLCINTLVRRQWTEEAKLSFPIIQLPLEMSRNTRVLFRSRLMWIGLGVAALIDLINGLHVIWPEVPAIMGERIDLRTYVRAAPWSGIGWTPLAVYPFAVGLAFLIPLDLAFSCWFFYLLWKGVRILSTALGWGNIPGAPWIAEQSFLSYIVIGAFGLWSGRRQLVAAVRNALGLQSDLDDSREPLPYAWALYGGALGLIALLVFSMQAGASWWSAGLFFALYFFLSTAIARVRAELGSPVHDQHHLGPEQIVVDLLGPRALGVKSLIVYSYFEYFNRAHRSHPMPVQLEALKLVEQTGGEQRRMAPTLMLAAAVGLVAGFWALLDACYRWGGSIGAGKGNEAWGRLATWLQSPLETNWYAVSAMGVGGAFTVFLQLMRANFVWWPFHPAGFCVSGGWSMALFSPSIFVSWLVKSILLRYGGISSFRPASMFFFGLILGEFSMGSIWTILGIILRRPMYNVLP